MQSHPAYADIDRCIHDAEHAEAGVEFAEQMARIQPGNPDHAKYAKELSEKAVKLRAEAQRIADEFGLDLASWGQS